MKKVDYYEFWKEFYPDKERFIEVEELYKELNYSDLSEDTNNMLEKFNKSKSTFFQNDDIDFYFKYKNDDVYKEEHKYFEERVMYYNFYRPFVNYFINNLYSHKDYFESIDFSLLLQSLEKGLLSALTPLGGRVLIRETEIKRKKQELIGETNKDRFCYFNNNCLVDKGYILNLYYKYPILFNIVKQKTILYSQYIVSVLSNIEKDKDDIKKYFNIDILNNKLVDLDTGAGDDHNNGKSVMVLCFENNDKVLYKPRNLQLDLSFNKFLEWLNSKGLKHKLKAMKILNKDDYGYVEFVNNNPCSSEELIKKYYERSGYFLALIYSLNGSDLHYENIIADGENPMIIDLETLFNPKVQLKNIDNDGQEFAMKKIYSSVLNIGMLPLMLRNENLTAELGGLGADKEQISPFKTYSVKNRETDEIKVECVNDIIGVKKNNPILNNKAVDSKNYVEQIIQGFNEMYKLIIEIKEEYKAIVKELFDDTQVRVLLRSTMEYESLLEITYHPDILMDDLSRNVLLCRIGISNEVDMAAKVLEYRSLVKGDIPYFNIKTNELHLYSEGNKIENEFDCTSMDYFIEKVDSMNEQDLKLQEKFIYNSYLNKRAEYDLDKTMLDFNKVENQYSISDEEYLKVIKLIADKLVSEGILYTNEADKYRIFIGSTFDEDDRGYSNIDYVGRTLYDGQAGIALFLTYCGKVFKEEKYYLYAKETLMSSFKFIENADMNHPYTIGAFSGIGGEFFALYNLYSLSKDETLKKYVIKYLELFENIIEGDKLFDIVSGSAGLMHILMSLVHRCKDKELSEKMEACIKKAANHLILNVKEIDENCMTWSMKLEGNNKNYTGFGHGNAGIISALARYSNMFSVDLSDLIKKVLSYENTLFDEKSKNWFRDNDKDMISLGWCHGAPGILLNKIILIENGLGHLVEKDNLNIALQTTLNKSFGNNPSLCHGDLGNLEILYLASKVLGEKELEEKCKMAFQWIFENVIKERWEKNSFRGIQVLGLMIGLVGFGYSILKFKYFDNIPSILYFS